MKYESFRYLWPPRPETKIAPTDLGVIESMGWWGQAKMNGTCCTIYVDGSGASVAMGRHGPEHKLDWQPGKPWQAFAASLPGKGYYVFVGELLHSKGVGVKDTIVLFDLWSRMATISSARACGSGLRGWNGCSRPTTASRRSR